MSISGTPGEATDGQLEMQLIGMESPYLTYTFRIRAAFDMLYRCNIVYRGKSSHSPVLGNIGVLEQQIERFKGFADQLGINLTPDTSDDRGQNVNDDVGKDFYASKIIGSEGMWKIKVPMKYIDVKYKDDLGSIVVLNSREGVLNFVIVRKFDYEKKPKKNPAGIAVSNYGFDDPMNGRNEVGDNQMIQPNNRLDVDGSKFMFPGFILEKTGGELIAHEFGHTVGLKHRKPDDHDGTYFYSGYGHHVKGKDRRDVNIMSYDPSPLDFDLPQVRIVERVITSLEENGEQ